MATVTPFSKEIETAAASSPEASVESDFTVRGTCVLKPDRVVRLKALVGGQITSVVVERGDKVNSGQILASIDISELRLRQSRNEIELEKLKQRAKLLQFQIERAERELSVVQMSQGTATPFLPKFGKEMAALQEKKSDLQENEINQRLNKLDRETIDDALGKSVIRAPFSGTILMRSVEPGMIIGSGSQNIGGGDVLFEIADPSMLVANCQVKEADALSLKNGDEVFITVEGTKHKPVSGNISRLSPVIANEGGISRREFYVVLDKAKDRIFLPGMNAEVRFKSDKKAAL